MITYEKLKLSLKRLEEQHAYLGKLDPDQPENVRDGIAESVIQRFEVCYDTLWKAVRRHLMENFEVAPPDSPKAVFKVADSNGLLTTPVEQWFEYVKARNSTSHDYDGEKAKECLKLIPRFIEDAIGLYQVLANETWE